VEYSLYDEDDDDYIPSYSDVEADISLVGVSIDTKQVVFAASHASETETTYPRREDEYKSSFKCHFHLAHDVHHGLLFGLYARLAAHLSTPHRSVLIITIICRSGRVNRVKLPGDVMYVGHSDLKDKSWSLDPSRRKIWVSASDDNIGYRNYTASGVIGSFDSLMEVDLDVLALIAIPCDGWCGLSSSSSSVHPLRLSV
jgi:hypothetical protein